MSRPNTTGREFDDNALQPATEVVPMEQITAMEKAQIDQLVSTAKTYPRDVVKAKNSAVEMATMDLDTATSCFYTLKRTDKDGNVNFIEGPSIRCAEIVKSTWGNFRSGYRVMGVDKDNGEIVCQAFAHDLESNVFVMAEERRRIRTKSGRLYGSDMINVTGRAGCQVAHRNAIMGVVPKSIGNAVFKAAHRMATADTAHVTKRWAKVCKFFSVWHISEDHLREWLGMAEDAEPGTQDLARIQGLYTSLVDGETALEKEFPGVFRPVAGQDEEPPKEAPTVDDAKPAGKPEPSIPEPEPETAEEPKEFEEPAAKNGKKKKSALSPPDDDWNPSQE